MKLTEYYCVITFHNTHHSLIFEKELKQRSFKVRLMPVPRQVSSSCGTAAEFPCHLKDDILNICHEEDIEVDEVHKIEKKDNENWFTKFLEK